MLTLGFLGTTELIVLVLVVLLLFGASRLPALARSVGLSIREFKSGMKDQIEDDKQDGEKKR
jgi:sec-independent protein translocase protein TatA